MLVATITLPEASARKLASDTDPHTAADNGYVMKSVIAETLGIVVRPFRGLVRDGVLKIVGFTDIEVPATPKPTAAKLGCDISFFPWEPDAGAEIWLDVLACPMQSVTPPKKEKPDETFRRQIDVIEASKDKFAGRPAAYNRWLQERLVDPASGCSPLSVVRFTQTGAFDAIRKTSADRRTTKKFAMPMFAGSVKVRVEDPEVFCRFLATGVGRQRGYGYGATIPKEILHEIAN